MKIAIAGAAGNLGTLLAHYLAQFSHPLILLTHNRILPDDLKMRKNVEIRQIDLGSRESLNGCLGGVDCVISLAGVLFRGAPETFLPITNIQYVENLANEAVQSGIKKFILLSFPHVEGESFPESPAKGLLSDSDPAPIHARTRMAAERSLIRICNAGGMRYLILRAGVIYGKGVKLTDAAKKYLRYHMLAIWRKPTWIHLLSLPDFLEITKYSIERVDLDGILNIADDRPIVLKDFLNLLAQYHNCSKPHILPEGLFRFAANSFDLISRIFRCTVPLNPDILQMGMMSAVCDTSRLKNELGYQLKYPTLKEGIVLT
jgi:nucleoside-diphosphate-sugar epimerase